MLVVIDSEWYRDGTPMEVTTGKYFSLAIKEAMANTFNSIRYLMVGPIVKNTNVLVK
jgi:hypothetical protein